MVYAKYTALEMQTQGMDSILQPPQERQSGSAGGEI